METLFGLPAHSLLIHAPIVLLPVAAVVTIALALRPSWRQRFGMWAVGGVFAVLVMLFLAKESGEAFDEAFDGAVDVRRHAELADTTFLLTVLWFVVFAGLVGYEFVMRRRAPRAVGADVAVDGSAASPVVGIALGAVASILAVLATVWLVRTGHAGSDAVWGTTTDQLFGG